MEWEKAVQVLQLPLPWFQTCLGLLVTCTACTRTPDILLDSSVTESMDWGGWIVSESLKG